MNKKISYSELKSRTERVAVRLSEVKVGSNIVVGIRMSRTIDLIVAYMAIIKVGGVILPIDEALPESRIQYMIKDSNCSLVLTDELLEHLVSYESNEIFQELKLKKCLPSMLSIAYIMYTSGTTGTPKGVPITYNSFWSFLKSFTEAINFNSEDIIVALTTICFDISMVELVLPLLCGMTILMLEEKTINNPYLLLKAIELYNITIMQTTPSRMELLLDAGRKREWFHKIKKVLIGGEYFPISLRDRLIACGKMEIYNVYGPTEATIWISTTKVKNKGPIDLGIPLLGNKFYILDDNNEVIKQNGRGELCISGSQVTSGYLNNPDQNMMKFKYCHQVEENIYLTGDIVERIDNQYYYLGRKDEQVKIRGYRIELTEIEYHMKNIKGIRNAKVLEAKGKYGSYLIGFYVAQEPIKSVEISNELRRYLASYMIPSNYVYLNEIPFNFNGKIDKKKMLELAFEI